MGFSEFMSRLFQVRKAAVNGTLPPTFPQAPVSFSNGEAFLQIDTVYACVSLFADVISTLPKLIVERATNKPAPNHPVFALLNFAPNEFMDPENFWSYIINSILLTGNGYAKIERSPILRLIPVSPLTITEVRLAVDTAGNYQKQFVMSDGTTVLDGDMLHFCSETMHSSGLKGESVLAKYSKRTMEHCQNVEQYAFESFRKGTNVNGVIEVAESLSAESSDSLNKQIKEYHGGVQTGGGVLILDAGKKFSDISITPDDEKFIKSEQFSVERICRIFRTPLHLVQSGQQQSYNSNEANSATWSQFSVVPKTKRIETQINRKLLGPNYYCEFDFDELLRPNTVDRFAANISACGRPFKTVNEVRTTEGLQPQPYGDTLFIPANISNTSGLDNGGGGDGAPVQSK